MNDLQDRLAEHRAVVLTVIDLKGGLTSTAFSHGSDLAGVNAFEVASGDLCAEPCEWCKKLVTRCRSRGGRVVESARK